MYERIFCLTIIFVKSKIMSDHNLCQFIISVYFHFEKVFNSYCNNFEPTIFSAALTFHTCTPYRNIITCQPAHKYLSQYLSHLINKNFETRNFCDQIRRFHSDANIFVDMWNCVVHTVFISHAHFLSTPTFSYIFLASLLLLL